MLVKKIGEKVKFNEYIELPNLKMFVQMKIIVFSKASFFFFNGNYFLLR